MDKQIHVFLKEKRRFQDQILRKIDRLVRKKNSMREIIERTVSQELRYRLFNPDPLADDLDFNAIHHNNYWMVRGEVESRLLQDSVHINLTRQIELLQHALEGSEHSELWDDLSQLIAA